MIVMCLFACLFGLRMIEYKPVSAEQEATSAYETIAVVAASKLTCLARFVC